MHQQHQLPIHSTVLDFLATMHFGPLFCEVSFSPGTFTGAHLFLSPPLSLSLPSSLPPSFLSYAASPANFEYMLDRMVGCDADGLCDDIMRLSSCVSGNYWYFPCQTELKKFL